MVRNIILPPLMGYQREVYDWMMDEPQGKVGVIKSVRQSGKSVLCQILSIAFCLSRPKFTVIFIEPTNQNARVQFKCICDLMDGSNTITVANASLLEIQFVNGSQIIFRSQESSNRGYTANLLILDECAYLTDDAIFTILPLANATNAPILIASTPFTSSGYYYDMFMLGLSGKNKSVRSFDWSKNKEVSRFLTEERKAYYKQTMSRAKYTTEVLGEFLGDEGLLFRGINECIIDNPSESGSIFMGIDFGTGSDGDYTVLAVFADNRMIRLFRTNNLSPMQQVDWLARKINQFTPRKILAEQNSIGKVYIDALNSRIGKTKITNWNTSNSSKQNLVTNLQIALENKTVSLLRDDVLLDELRKYQAEINTKTKTVSYNGKGAHDDTVIATMLAYYGYKNNFGHYAITAI